ncbi:MAG TPA: acyl-CoA dehydrogenase family protein [Candidatus Methylomirabilis sp.]|nr:acyl-CoA dehydrogenase family protein [Candidatus Methylomirabilis sp.]
MTVTGANQPPPLEGYNLFRSDRALVDALHREGAGWADERVTEVGELVGGEPLVWGHQANAHAPVLKSHDRFGERIDEVEFHPAWHAMMRFSIGHGVHALPWRERRPGAHVARAALLFLVSQAEAGHACPVSMTFAATPLLQAAPEVGPEWVPRLTSLAYDERALPVSRKSGALCGMAMTERQGGSDVRANTTRASLLSGAGPGAEYAITGRKWFCSAPMCDAFVVLAQTERGLSCFLLPRWRPDGTRNGFHIERLKDKLGNRSNASAEVVFDAAWARLVGEEGRGITTIMEMVSHARLECLIASAALMRQAVAQATHHAAHRRAFGRRLEEYPLMQNVLADLAVESEAATAAALRLARAYDERTRNEAERRFARFATPLVKYWICKRTPPLVAEALECLGGNGYVEECILPRLYREAPVNSVWEGSGNVMCVDVLRALTREGESVDAFFDELGLARGLDRRLDAFIEGLRDGLTRREEVESGARRIVERLALALEGSLLVRGGHPAMADAFVASRLAGDHGLTFGTLPAGLDFKAILERARPVL